MSNVWGVTRRRDFVEVCPIYFAAKYIFKAGWHESPNKAMNRGSEKHTTLEHAIKYNLEITDPELSSVRDYAYQLAEWKQQGIQVEPEFKIGLTADLQYTEFFKGQGIRSRWATDVLVRIEKRGLSIDWKTGRYKEEHKAEAKQYGAAFAVALGVDEMQTQYVYIDDPESTFTLDIPPALEIHPDRSWRHPEANAVEIMLDLERGYAQADAILAEKILPAMQANDYKHLARPGRHCGWCGKLDCPFNTNEARYAAGRTVR